MRVEREGGLDFPVSGFRFPVSGLSALGVRRVRGWGCLHLGGAWGFYGGVRIYPFFVALLAVLACAARAADDYKPGPEAQPQAGGPKGDVRQGTWAASKVFPGTTRDYFVYVPKQYDPARPANLLVCFDGAGFFNATGAFRLPVVLDNLIAKGDLPPTIAVGVNPGTIAPALPGAKPRSNRSFEYDSLGDANARFLLEELLPEALKGLAVASDPKQRAVMGNSSGGIAAFTVAWERPESFGNVISHIGSFTNIRGGHVYPALIRKVQPKKPIRVFLQEGKNDLNNLHGSWPLANEDMAAALKFSGYDYTIVWGEGGHSGKHGGQILPDTLRWVWGKR